MYLLPDRNPASSTGKLTVYQRGQTALGKQLDPMRANWLLQFCISKWNDLHSSCHSWRTKLLAYEKRADDDYTERMKQVDHDRTDAARPIFERENNSLGIISSAVDQVFAKGKNEIFGTRPWLAATPQQATDRNLADDITRHSQWKADQSNLEETLTDSIKLALDLGTTFVKLRWLKDVETFLAKKPVAFSKSGKAPILREDGEHVTTDEELAAMVEAGAVMGGDVEWREIEVEDTRTVYNNVEAANLDFKDVAFNPSAPELCLRYTPFFCRFRMGLHDVVEAFQLSDEQRETLANQILTFSLDENPRPHRDEHTPLTAYDHDTESNPPVTLIEGFLRCDPLGKGSPISLRIVFSPELQSIFHVDYLANITPDGILPVFPVRCFKVPRRIIGKGYRERFEKGEDCIDGMYNAIVVRQRESADVFTGVRKDLLEDESEGKDIVVSPNTILELKPEVDNIGKVLSFAVKPDNNNRTDALMQQMIQMLQMRMATVSASQSDLLGVPSNDTATGSKQIQNQVDTVTGCQIDQIMKDLEKPVEFFVHLNYANQDYDETFTWGEGKDAELVSIKAGDVQGLRANVSLSLTQSQNLQKLESAKAAIDIATKYAMLPEPEKAGQRILFIQALKGLGFNDADKIVRDAVLDAAGIAAMLPENVRPAFEQWLMSQGMAAPSAEPGAEQAPETQQPAA